MVQIYWQLKHDTQDGSSPFTCCSTYPRAQPSISGRNHTLEPPVADQDTHSPPNSDVVIYKGKMDVNIGDYIHAANYKFGVHRRITLWINGRKVATSQNTSGAWINYQVVATDLIGFKEESPTPIYLEQLHKLDSYSSSMASSYELRRRF